ncbi:MAG: ClC family H(+)/Cl(-) exchange transporter [Eubacterium sp.]|nr:ClC family H(+)/Cl(-) exchange transporter [Eubacterium sp.]
MNYNKKTMSHPGHSETGGTLFLILEGVIVGALAALVAVLYRFLLTKAESSLRFILSEIRGKGLYIALWFVALAILGFLVARIVRFEPMSSGSGIPQVSGEIKGFLDPVWWKVLLAKIVGGTLSIFGGLSLGREGPSVQLGAMAAKGFSRVTKREHARELTLISCGAGAGLAAAFNAPFAGLLFILEEMHHSFERSLLVAGMVSTLTADFVSKIFFGQSVIFTFGSSTLPLHYYWLLIILGILLGLAGAGYNYVMLKFQALFQKCKKVPIEVGVILTFLIAGVLGFLLPEVLGGGHAMVVLLEEGRPAIVTLIILLVAKFLFSALSFGSGAPGGIFFPLLVLGSFIGAIFGSVVIQLFPLDEAIWSQFIIIGMAGLFSSITRVPITGVVLIVEMTGSMHRLLDIALVCFISYVVANLTGSKPIYDSLLDNILKNKKNSN